MICLVTETSFQKSDHIIRMTRYRPVQLVCTDYPDAHKKVVCSDINFSTSQDTHPLQDLQDVRDYMSECHARITHHNAKLDKRAKVLEKELRVAMDSQNHVSTIFKD